MIEVIDVKRAFRNPSGGKTFWALKGISLEVPTGKLTVLMGKSGSGKTTLMNIISALDQPTEGKVLFDGHNITRMNENDRCMLRRKKIGFVFQSVALIDVMSARENVMFALRMGGRYKTERERIKRADECLHLVGLGQRGQHMPQELSGGERQRVAIARAIANRPSVVFADEPTAQLDTNTALQVAKIFRDLTDETGMTTVFTTHDVGLSVIGDRIYELSDGKLIRSEERTGEHLETL